MRPYNALPKSRLTDFLARPFRVVYHHQDSNHCPACGRQHWIVGRVTAECAFCETALPLEHISGHGYAPRFIQRGVGEEMAPRPA